MEKKSGLHRQQTRERTILYRAAVDDDIIISFRIRFIIFVKKKKKTVTIIRIKSRAHTKNQFSFCVCLRKSATRRDAG